jgi:anti-sigma factor RsiW
MPPRPDDCAAILPLLDPFLDGELAGVAAERVRIHLADCPACAAELELTAALLGGLRDLPELDAPQAVLARVIAAAAEGAAPEAQVLLFPRSGGAARPPAPSRPRWAALAAVLALALFSGLLLFQLAPPRSSRPSPREVAQATAEARYALALVARASRRSGLALRDEVLPDRLVAPAARALSYSLREPSESDSAPRQGS